MIVKNLNAPTMDLADGGEPRGRMHWDEARADDDSQMALWGGTTQFQARSCTRKRGHILTEIWVVRRL